MGYATISLRIRCSKPAGWYTLIFSAVREITLRNLDYTFPAVFSSPYFDLLAG